MYDDVVGLWREVVLTVFVVESRDVVSVVAGQHMHPSLAQATYAGACPACLTPATEVELFATHKQCSF